eukprot:4265918-Pleurochrysis_carterae.AAC.5
MEERGQLGVVLQQRSTSLFVFGRPRPGEWYALKWHKHGDESRVDYPCETGSLLCFSLMTRRLLFEEIIRRGGVDLLHWTWSRLVDCTMGKVADGLLKRAIRLQLGVGAEWGWWK